MKEKTQKQMKKIRKQMDSYIKNVWYTNANIKSPVYTLNKNGRVDIHLAVSLKTPYHIKKLPFKINSTANNLTLVCNQLTTLEGLPKHIKGNLEIDFSPKITSLAYCPEKIDGNFECFTENITSTHGAPAYVGGNVSISGNRSVIVDFPGFVEGNFKVVMFDVIIKNMPTVNGIIDIWDDDFKIKSRRYIINEIINHK